MADPKGTESLRSVAHLGNSTWIRKWFNHRSRDGDELRYEDTQYQEDRWKGTNKRPGPSRRLTSIIWLIMGLAWDYKALALGNCQMAMERESLELLDKELNCLSKRSAWKIQGLHLFDNTCERNMRWFLCLMDLVTDMKIKWMTVDWCWLEWVKARRLPAMRDARSCFHQTHLGVSSRRTMADIL